jgi:cobaltochelatase CobS
MNQKSEAGNIMNMEQIECRLCGVKCHAIKAHLKEAHSVSSAQPMALNGYQAQFPDAPVLSELMMKKLAERKKLEEDQGEIIKPKEPKPESQNVSKGGYIKKPMYEVFSLDKKRTMTGSGKQPEVSVSLREDSADRVPAYEEYYPDIEALKNVMLALEFNEPIMLYGHAGVGKTSIFRFVARGTNRRLVRVQHTAETQEHKILGQMQVSKGFDETGKAYSYTEFQVGDLPLAMKNGWIYLADEIDRAQPEVLSAYQSVLEGQPLHLPEADEDNRLITPHPDFRFVATGNSNGMGDETGIHRAVQRQDAATFERFSIVMQLGYLDKSDEVAMLKEKAQVSAAHAEKLWSFADKIRNQFPHEFPLTIGPRVLIKIGRLGRLKGNFSQGVKLAYANRLPEAERKAAMDLASRILG